MHRILSWLIHSAVAIVTRSLWFLPNVNFEEEKNIYKGLTDENKNNFLFFFYSPYVAISKNFNVIGIELIQPGVRIRASTTYCNSQRESRSLQEVHATQRKRVFDVSECLSRDERDEY